MNTLKNKIKNNALFFHKFAFCIKKNCTFAASSLKTWFIVGAVFSFATLTAENAAKIWLPFNGCCTTKTAIVLSEIKKGSLFLFESNKNNININFSIMLKTLKNASGVNASQAREACENGFEKRLNIIGVKNNIVLFLLRKSFREFLNEESKGFLCSDLRLTKKIEAVKLLFPEYRKSLTNLEERRQYV